MSVSLRLSVSACLIVLTGCGGETVLSTLPPPSTPGTTQSSVTLVATPQNEAIGKPITLQATMAPSSATGSIQFLDLNRSELGNATLQSGTASLTNSNSSSSNQMETGLHLLYAAYSGDSHYATSQSIYVPVAVSSTNANCGLATATKLFTSSSTETNGSYSASNDNQSAVCVTGANTSVTLNQPTVQSSARGMAFFALLPDWTGMGAAVLANAGGNLALTEGSITSTGTAAPAVFASDGAITSSGTTITTNELLGYTSSGNIISGYVAGVGQSGTLSLTNSTVSANSSSRGLLAILGSGTLNMQGGSLSGTPLYGAFLDGNGSLTLNNVNLNMTSAISLLEMEADPTNPASQTDTVTLNADSLTGSNANQYIFEVEDVTANVTLDSMTIPTTAFTSALLHASGTTNLTASASNVSGNISVDSGATANITLQNNSQWSGAFQQGYGGGNPTPVFALTLDATSLWNVTQNTQLTTLTDPDGISNGAITNIKGNGFTVTYDAAQNPALAGKTYALANGGTLSPAQ